jgi:hypothetical protein
MQGSSFGNEFNELKNEISTTNKTLAGLNIFIKNNIIRGGYPFIILDTIMLDLKQFYRSTVLSSGLLVLKI